MVRYEVVNNGGFVNRNDPTLVKMAMLLIFVAIGVVISPILRAVGFCPIQHFVNIVCAIFLEPWYALLCVTLTRVIRTPLVPIPPLVPIGAVFGAFLSGVPYKGMDRLIVAYIGKVIGTGIAGSTVGVPAMRFSLRKSNLTLLFYTPPFVLAALIGTTAAFVPSKAMWKSKMLDRLEESIDG